MQIITDEFIWHIEIYYVTKIMLQIIQIKEHFPKRHIHNMSHFLELSKNNFIFKNIHFYDASFQLKFISMLQFMIRHESNFRIVLM